MLILLNYAFKTLFIPDPMVMASFMNDSLKWKWLQQQMIINVNIWSMKKNQLFLRLKSEPKVQTGETSFSYNFLIQFLSHNNNNNNNNNNICHSRDNRFLSLEILIVSVLQMKSQNCLSPITNFFNQYIRFIILWSSFKLSVTSYYK